MAELNALGIAAARENTAASQFSFGRAIRILGIPVRKDRRLFHRIILPRLARHRGFHRALCCAAPSSLGEPTPFLRMISQPSPGSGELIPMEINRVRDSKTRFGTDGMALMNLSEFAGLDSAILEKSNENFPACGTVVKWLGLTGSVYSVKIHFGAKLDSKPLRVTRKLVTDETTRRLRKPSSLLFQPSKRHS
jgi:hypothetical protein